MAFQTPVTAEDILRAIHQKQYLLPAIQREFVWSPDQIRRLFDSLMRGYPIGSFLLWKVDAASATAYTFYDFLTDYHERDNPYANKATVPTGSGITAVLDGQQRLTALNIAIYGSHAEKRKHAWWNNPDAFPRKRLYLNLTQDAVENNDLGLRYDLRFLTEKEAAPEADSTDRWYRVGDVLTLENSGPAMYAELLRRKIGMENAEPYQRLYDLFRSVREQKPVNYYLEGTQDADKVLDIFVRVNSGGTTLSYSDLLLSMATNQWQHLDAREEVRKLVQELNSGGSRIFSFSKDVVLKTALMVAGVDLRFQVSNFTQTNMRKVESAWPDTRGALLRATAILNGFGFNERTLTAASVVVPIAYYLARRGLTDNYLTSGADAKDRLVLRQWITRSLMKRGIWGSGLDTLLSRIRDAIDEEDTPGFPGARIEKEMGALGKTLSFEATEIDDLLELKYGGQRTFAALALLYPGLDFAKQFHEDHIFPRARFTAKKLRDAGISPDAIDDYTARIDLLPNLQLLGGVANVEKQAKLPGDWLTSAFASEAEKTTYVSDNDLQDLPLGIEGFVEFFETRKTRMRERLSVILGVGA
ncbi:DUF262 domain-containing protein [Actinoplanes couchii]|uniref:GmrSD restriction endonucleases N-terminal domain-containing protein n=1 Tax=Actinoplanes couchii TaxID=403638 RepID=A0ABQ3XLZ4_9ACTN|nr:DUF262 domain-containing protein [Actinoplanes couchii]MDR6319259.1 hypothetical protein [Actinoplanes couchii]GID59532.1 hypothetical protein Aco03nite_079360 [Actinoplanes couchii]